MTARRVEVSATVHSTTAWGVLEQLVAIVEEAGIVDLMTVEIVGERVNNQGTLVNLAGDKFDVVVVGFGSNLEPARVTPPLRGDEGKE